MGRFAILLLCAAPVFAAPVPKAKAKLTMEGTWEVLERQNHGEAMKVQSREYWVFGDGSYSIFKGLKGEIELSDLNRRTVNGTYEIPDAKDSSAFDLKQGTNQNICRMSLEGDVLHIAISIDPKRERPAEGKPGQGVAYIKLQRVDESKLKAK